MKLITAVVLAFALTGCATSQNVTLAQNSGGNKPATAALVSEDGNSPSMNSIVRASLLAQGVTPQATLPPGTRTASNVDSIVSYSDVWRWDLVMYLKSITISMFDAKSGDLLVMGRWDNSAFHGFQDAKAVVDELLSERVAKLKTAPATAPASQLPAAASVEQKAM